MALASSRRSRRRWLIIVVLLIIVALVAWYQLLREVSLEHAAIDDHFKYGSIGVEAASGAPYWVWYVLPSVCGDGLTGREGYARFGFIWEDEQPGPIGMPVKTIGFQRIGVSCSLCHTATYRETADAASQIVLGAPNSTIDMRSYLQFLLSCAADPRFNASNVIAEIDEVYDLSIIERLLYRFLIIPQTKAALLRQKIQLGWIDQKPAWGSGRQDPFNPAKVQILQLPFDDSIGNSDIPPLWNFSRRPGGAYHWDGLNTSLTEVFLNSGIGNGASAKTIDLPALQRIQDWATALPAAVYPFSVDQDLVVKGRPLFDEHCADCHAFEGRKTGKPVPLSIVNTDRHRLGTWSAATAQAFNDLDLYPWRYTGFRDTYGYVAVPLDGIWIRGPYLHNGSVPTLADLLKTPARRPAVFYTGYNVYDQESVGFVAHGAEAEHAGWRFDITVPGNANSGHIWGTDLSDDEKAALVEFLKTL